MNAPRKGYDVDRFLEQLGDKIGRLQRFERAVEAACSARGLELTLCTRRSRYEVQVTYNVRDPASYASVLASLMHKGPSDDVHLPHVKLPTDDEIDAELFEAVCSRLDDWLRTAEVVASARQERS